MNYPHQMNARISEADLETLNFIIKKTGMSTGQIIRAGIALVAAQHRVQADVCHSCGTKYASASLYCHHCGTSR